MPERKTETERKAGTERKVVVVGAGVAGLAAAEALTRDGAQVTVLERRSYVGGRAYSYLHPALNEIVDSQHVLVGCCTNLIDFCKVAGLADDIRWYDRQTFLEPATSIRPVRASHIAPGILPAPSQYTGSFLQARMLSISDKLSVARGLAELVRGYPADDSESVSSWYRRTSQTTGAIHHFWDPILIATLNDHADNCSFKYAGKVFHELFLRSNDGGRLGIPTTPLSDFYAGGTDLIVSRGARMHFRAGVEGIAQQPDGRWLLTTGDFTCLADDVILALPFEQTQKLLTVMQVQGQPETSTRDLLLDHMSHFLHSPFISVLLWFDRQITDLDHAWLLDTTIQWFFHKSRIRSYPEEQGSYVELVIAGSRSDLPKSRAEILTSALAELQRFFPEVAHARLVKSGILKEARATFSVTPGLDRFRPDQATGIPGLYLAGDWTHTEWPSTMEGAARSGRLAAGAVRGKPEKFLSPELPATGLMPFLT